MTGRWRRSLPAACWPARYPGQTRRESVEPGTVWLFAERFRAIMRAARPAASKLLNRAAAKRGEPLFFWRSCGDQQARGFCDLETFLRREGATSV